MRLSVIRKIYHQLYAANLNRKRRKRKARVLKIVASCGSRLMVNNECLFTPNTHIGN